MEMSMRILIMWFRCVLLEAELRRTNDLQGEDRTTWFTIKEFSFTTSTQVYSVTVQFAIFSSLPCLILFSFESFSHILGDFSCV